MGQQRRHGDGGRHGRLEHGGRRSRHRSARPDGPCRRTGRLRDRVATSTDWSWRLRRSPTRRPRPARSPASPALDQAPIESRLRSIAKARWRHPDPGPRCRSRPPIARPSQLDLGGRSRWPADRLRGHAAAAKSPRPGTAGVTFIAATTGEKVQVVPLDAPATGLTDVDRHRHARCCTPPRRTIRSRSCRSATHRRDTITVPVVVDHVRDARRGQQARLQRRPPR